MGIEHGAWCVGCCWALLMTGAPSSAIAAHAAALEIVTVLERPMDGDDVLDLVETAMRSPY